MYVRMYVCMYVWYVCMYICMYICMYACMYVRMELCINKFTFVTGFWKTDHIVTREINRISMFMYL